jgi:Cu(I)/Ag(I) efflux system membrane fusion protein
MKMDRKAIGLGGVILLAGVVLGAVLFGDGGSRRAVGSGEELAEAIERGTKWTCAMHPQIQESQPGKCPICAMNLIPAGSGGGNVAGARELVMSVAAKKLARIETVAVERRLAEASVRLVGKVDYDETKKKTISAWFPARIDRLYVDYTGIEVNKSDHLARVYSPELMQAQRELLIAAKGGRGNADLIREKLRLWGMPEARIKSIEESGKASDQMDIDASGGGIVIHKNVSEGDYVQTGDELFEIADLSRVWVQLDAYESDLPWIRYGQKVVFEAEAVPGKQFEGIVAFIAPVLDGASRTVKVRVNAENPGGQLKPGMFVRAHVKSTIADAGKVISPELAGKWISPMHPEIIRDEPGDCPICGMKLVKAEELGYEALIQGQESPLVVPTSAVLKTGKRAVVYVEVPDREDPTYAGREIVLGARAGDVYLVEEGLEEGERVVVEGNFKIDSALQIVAKPSMMSPGRGEEIHWHPDASEATAVLDGYLAMQEALAGDNLAGAQVRARTLEDDLRGGVLEAVVSGIAAAETIETARDWFARFSQVMVAAGERGELGAGRSLYRVVCGMALSMKGAEWVQATAEIRNPYFGAEMLECGTIEPLKETGDGR